MIKKCRAVFAFLLTAVLTLGSVLTAYAAGGYFLYEDFYYGVQNKEAYVHGYEGTEWDMVIREKFLSYYVTAVEEYAFFENETIRQLSFYDATQLRSLGDFAFARCTKLEAVNITSSIQEMGISVFDGCTALEYVRFRNGSVKDIPAQAFYGCTALKTAVFENEPTAIGRLAFAKCAALEAVEIPESVTFIADNAFDGCDNLVIYCTSGSTARQYAAAHNIRYELTDAEPFVIGDANGDGVVNVNDVTEVQRHAAELESLTGARFEAADVNGDGAVDIDDATNLQRYLAEYETGMPIGSWATHNP